MKAPRQPVTLRVIAERAAVSVCTVSLSLRNHPRIPAGTRNRIQTIARQLGYRPDAMISTLMARIHTRRSSSESPVLGMILDEVAWDFSHQVPFYQDLVRGAHERAFQLGYQVENLLLKPGTAAARALTRNLHARNIRGVIIAPVFQSQECLLSFEGLASCALGYSLHQPDLHRVVPNYSEALRLSWDKLIEYGYRRPGLLVNKEGQARIHYEQYGAFAAQQARYEGVAAAIPPLVLLQDPKDHEDECFEQLRKWHRRHRPDVLFFPPWNFLERLKRSFRIPEEIGVITLDVVPDWSQVRHGADRIGAGAVDLIVAQIHRNETGVPSHPKLMAIDNVWIDGFSLPRKKK